MIEFFKTTIYEPLYNVLIFFIDVLPGHQVAYGVIALTILVKLLLVPLFQKMLKTQYAMRKIQPEIEEIRKKYKDNAQEQGKQMLELYKKEKVNPFASILILIIQLPIVISLYYMIMGSGLPEINPELLYSFVPRPESISMMFFGIDLVSSSTVLAVLAGVSMYFQARYAVAQQHTLSTSKPGTTEYDVARATGFLSKYLFPFIIFFVSLGVSGAVALYFVTSNIFSLVQEVYFKMFIRPKYEK